MEFCTITFCVVIFTMKLAASSPFYGDELGRPSEEFQTLGASHNGYVPEGTPLGLTRSQNTNFRSNNAYQEPINPEHYGLSRNGFENNIRPQVGTLLSSRQANNEFSTLPININRNRYPHSSLGEESSFLNNPSETRFRSEPFESGNINFNHQPSGLHLSGLPVHSENIRNLEPLRNREPLRNLQNERIRNLEPMHTISEPYYNSRQNMFNINSYQNGAEIKKNNFPSNEHVLQNNPESLWNNVPLPNRGINEIQNLHQLVRGIHPGYNVKQLISNPQIKEALQNIGINSKKRYLVIHADGSVVHTDTLEPTIATNPNSLFLNREHVILNKHPSAVVTAKPEILLSPTAIDEVESPSVTANPLENLELNNEENENGPYDAKELLDKEIIAGLPETSKNPLKTVSSITHHSVHKNQESKQGSHHFSSTLKTSPSDDDDEYEESATKATLLTSSIAEYTDEEDDDDKNPLKSSSHPKKTPRTTTSSTKFSNTEYSVDTESEISTSTKKPPPKSTTTPQHNQTQTIKPPLTHKIATHLHHHTTAHIIKTSTTKSPSLKEDDSNDNKFKKSLKNSSTKTSMTVTPKIHKTSDNNEWDDDLKTSKSTKKPATPKTATTRKSHKLQHSATNKYPLRETPTTTKDLSEIDYEDEYEYYLTEKPPTKSHPIKNSKRPKSTTPTFTKRSSKTTRPSKRMSPKHYSSESEESDEESLKKNTENKYDDEDLNKHDESNLSIKKIKKSKHDSEDVNDNIGNKHNKSNLSIHVKRKNMASNKSKTNKKKGKDDEEDFENHDEKKVSYHKKNGTCCQQITKHDKQNLHQEHEDPGSLLTCNLNNITVVERNTLRTVYPNGTVIEEISDYLVDNNDDKIKISTKVNIIHPDEYEEEKESDLNSIKFSTSFTLS